MHRRLRTPALAAGALLALGCPRGAAAPDAGQPPSLPADCGMPPELLGRPELAALGPLRGCRLLRIGGQGYGKTRDSSSRIETYELTGAAGTLQVESRQYGHMGWNGPPTWWALLPGGGSVELGADLRAYDRRAPPDAGAP